MQKKEMGGLGLDDLELRAVAWQAHRAWDIMNGKSMWTELIRAKYKNRMCGQHWYALANVLFCGKKLLKGKKIRSVKWYSPKARV